MNEEFNFKEKAKVVLKKYGKKLFLFILPLIIIVALLSGFVYWITIDDGTYKEGDWSSTPYAAGQYTSQISINSEGSINSNMTAQELWDKMIEEGSRVNLYLNSPEELLKMMNAQVVTQFIDTRENPDEEIDWDALNDVNSNKVQGIIKLKRADTEGNIKTMTYVDPDTFQGLIDKYNETGSEEDREEALSHFTLKGEVSTAIQISQDTENNSSDNEDEQPQDTEEDSVSFTKYTDLTDEQLRGIANLCKQEQGSLEGAAAEASLMANLFEMKGSSFGTGGSGLYNYVRADVRDGGWFANAAKYMDNGSATDEYVSVVRTVLVEGKRTIPGYIDEHDCFSDIRSATNNGSAISVSDRSQYIANTTKINNIYGSSYTFYCFPTEASDPFGYTSEENRARIGDSHYDFDSGEFVTGSSSGSTSTTGGTGPYAVVATWSETTHRLETNDPNSTETVAPDVHTMTTTNINYQDFVSGYTMPFDYLWALLVTGEDKDFVLDLADLVHDSKIEITVHDNLTVTTNVKEYTYTKRRKTETTASATVSYKDESNSSRTASANGRRYK